ncbi:tRNA(Phe) 7-((3-amino-3-carboxypropyl)-4-demethyl wyosine(37)-N(4))-methyltransferase 1 [uncultured archaeon]|nr:tRNA(Phe) 7-((3-amino-3-carboxypropyl)-4-demethyl wyosine(37)-N(4))-methyltransferase 1 [uncultured archaeon]
MSFQQAKKDTLARPDKSYIGGVDIKIKPLCDKLNSLENYYTTSSCSGRVLIMIQKKQKDRELFLWISHSEISLNELKEEIYKITKKRKHKKLIVKFKLDPCIIHVACKTLEDADKLLKKAQLAGWKKNGIITLGKKIIVELNSTERLEFPLIHNHKLLVGEDLLKLIVEESNRKLNDSWLKIGKLTKSLR